MSPIEVLAAVLTCAGCRTKRRVVFKQPESSVERAEQLLGVAIVKCKCGAADARVRFEIREATA
jgi:hypothetical protein